MTDDLPAGPDPMDAYDDADTAGYTRDAWLKRRVIATVDLDRGGAYTWNPSAYSPVPILEDGDTGLVFAKT